MFQNLSSIKKNIKTNKFFHKNLTFKKFETDYPTQKQIRMF